MKVLRARLYEAKQREQDEAVGSERKNKIGTGELLIIVLVILLTI